MKPLILALLLTFPVLAVAQDDPKIIKQYDRFENRTRYWTEPAYVAHRLSLMATFSYQGQGEGNEVEKFGLIFTAITPDSRYAKNSRLYCIVDGKSIYLGSAKAVNRDMLPNSELGSVKEVLMFPVTYHTLQTIAQAKQVEMRLGSTEFQIERYVRSDIRELLSKVKVVKR